MLPKLLTHVGEISVTSTPNFIPRAGADGKLAAEWIKATPCTCDIVTTDIHSAPGVRTEAIVKDTAFTVPQYTVGANELSVFVDGLFVVGGTDALTSTYKEVGTKGATATTIMWHQDMPKELDLLIRATVISAIPVV